MPRRKIAGVFALVVLGLLAACARHVETQVTRFHEGSLPAGRTIVIMPADPAREGPEFRTYASMIADEFVKLGYRLAASPEEADLEVVVDYGVDQGRVEIETRPGYAYPYYGFYLGHFHPYHYGFFYPYIYDPFYGPDIESQTVYTRQLSLKIRDRQTGRVVFEGRAVSEGPTRELNLVMPYLVEAMFRNFPGESGVTRLVEIKTREGRIY
ncbi:MAG: hypothetical protein KatS3mg119_0068 [Rhodothalassiaceae bacterium]|nr:MAG: hypothetical protein KatS3mg119_0068 [Rhodothalassiaceae bacterium]